MSQAAREAAARFKSVVGGALAELTRSLTALPESGRKEFDTWTATFEAHVEDLAGIVDRATASALATAASQAADAQLRPANAWADPASAEQEMESLKAVRRQIRCLFGGMLSKLPDSGNVRVDDLLSDRPDVHEASGEEASPKPPRGARPPPVPSLPLASSGGGHGESEVSGSRSSMGSQEKKRDRRDKDRKAPRRPGDEEGGRPASLAGSSGRDEAMAAKQRSWAEQVVKASLDPQNQWEFPQRGEGAPGGGASTRKQSWEQPRQVRSPGQRGADVASKARERAEEVLRTERDRQPNRRLYNY